MADGEGLASPGNRQSRVTPERWKQVETIFEEVLEIPPGERSPFLERTCAGDEELRHEVDSLLESHGGAGTFLDNSDPFFSKEDLTENDSFLQSGTTIDHYRIVREIGRGGMGAVYLAERADAEYEKQVAIKLIKRGMDTDSVLRHFRNERQILASFDHPNIARLFDGGTTGGGLSYFVMEYVEGVPIDEYCNKHALSIGERLKLFREVCAAVSYAHRHLVIHRDIKRTNILVTAEGIPKLLDFGIAKILQQGDGAQPLATMTGLRLMTPEYASPEQIRGEAVTTASDVYSLGIILYELLTGSSPYRFTSRAPRDVERAITEQEPTRPSTAVLESNRNSAIANRKSLRGDLDNIVLMALRKEPERRYASVEQFSEDIRRHLEARPVLARKDTIGYRAAKFVRRNKAVVAAASLLFVSLLGGIITTTWEAHRARVQEAAARRQETLAKAEKARAERRFADVRQLAHSLLFDYHDAIKDLPGATRVRERLVKDALANLDKLAAEVQGDSILQRELAAAYERVGDVRGEAYGSANLGDRAGALDSYGKALRIREDLLASDPHDVQNRRALAAIHKKIGGALQETNEAKLGLEHLRKALTISSALAAEQATDPEIQMDLAVIYNAVGMALEDRSEMPEALENHHKGCAIWEKLVTAGSKNRKYRRGLSVSYENIGRVLALTGDVNVALETNAKAMTLRAALLNEDPTNADYRRILAVSYQNTGDYLALRKDNSGAVENFRKKLALDEQSYAADPANATIRYDLAYSCERLGELLADSGDYTAAASYDQRAIELYEKNTAADPQDSIAPLRITVCRARLGEAQAKMGNATSARAQCEQTLALLRAVPDDRENISQRSLRSQTYVKVGDAYIAISEARMAKSEDKGMARDCYQRALQIMQDDYNRGLLNADDEAQRKEVILKLASVPTP
jgi:serine/threonine protein kinase/tetratricopeptide (TPR) repeat protein